MVFLRSILPALGVTAGVLVGQLALQAQNVVSPATTIQTWRNTTYGMSSNSALAMYRLRHVGHPNHRTVWRTAPVTLGSRTLYSAPYFAITTRSFVPQTISPQATNPQPAAAQAAAAPRTAAAGNKPFSNLQRPPNAIERYWPLLLEAREDRRTGLVIWSLP